MLYPDITYDNILNVNLVDSDLKFPILKKIQDSNFLNYSNFKVKYYSVSESVDFDKDNVNLYSEIKSISGVEYAVFNIYSKNSLHQEMILRWSMPKEQSLNVVQHESVRNLMEFIINTKEKDVNHVIMDRVVTSDNITDFKVAYDEEAKNNYISGYDFTFESRPTSTHRFWRAFIELTLGNGLGVANYWLNKHENMEDWEYKPNSEGFKKKIKDGWAFDTNAFRTNTIYHIYAGTAYYNIGRSNGYGYLGSTLWAFSGSLMWEYIGEYREQVSTNDMIFTTMGGVLAGEALRQCGFYLEKNLPGRYLKYFLVFIIDPVRMINQRIDRMTNGNVQVNLRLLNPDKTNMKKAFTRNALGNITFRF